MDKPNIMMVLLDSLRADHCGILGYEKPTTPGSSYLAEKGVVYEQAISPGIWTMPSMGSLFTGVYPDAHRFVLLGDPLLDRYVTLAEALKDVGYNTYALGTSIPFFDFGLGRGFECLRPNILGSSFSRRALRGIQSLVRGKSGGHEQEGLIGNDEVEEKTEETEEKEEGIAGEKPSFPFMKWLSWVGGNWIDKGAKQVLRVAGDLACRHDKDRPFFIYVHIGETHGPYRPRRRYRRKYWPRDLKHIKGWQINQQPMPYYLGEEPVTPDEFRVLRALYDGEIEYQDRLVAALYRRLERAGAAENTIFIVLADHGDCIGEKGLVRHTFCVYDMLVHVPLIVVYPERKGARESRIVQTLDIPGTLASLAGTSQAFLDQQEGNSLLDPENGPRPADMAISEHLQPFSRQRQKYRKRLPQYDKGILGVRSCRYKYIWNTNGQEEFYCLETDPAEEKNRIGDAELVRQIGEFRGKAGPWINRFREAYDAIQGEMAGAESPDFSPEVEQRLRDLGYVD